MTRRCAVLILDRSSDPIVSRPCGAPAGHVIVINGDNLFAVCGRHNGRLVRAGVAL